MNTPQEAFKMPSLAPFFIKPVCSSRAASEKLFEAPMSFKKPVCSSYAALEKQFSTGLAKSVTSLNLFAPSDITINK